jgi:hypothetical protein
MCYILLLRLMSGFSKVKVRNNLSEWLLILAIDLIGGWRGDLNP